MIFLKFFPSKKSTLHRDMNKYYKNLSYLKKNKKFPALQQEIKNGDRKPTRLP